MHWSGDNHTQLQIPSSASSFASVSYVAVPTEIVDRTVHDYDEIPNDNAEVGRKKAQSDVSSISNDTNYSSITSHLQQKNIQLLKVVSKEHHNTIIVVSKLHGAE